jgi:hypothetical protein
MRQAGKLREIGDSIRISMVFHEACLRQAGKSEESNEIFSLTT